MNAAIYMDSLAFLEYVDLPWVVTDIWWEFHVKSPIRIKLIEKNVDAFNIYFPAIWVIAFFTLDKAACIKLQDNSTVSLLCVFVNTFLQTNDMNQWLQVELPQIKKITGIITQGAKSLGKEMYVISYTLQYSDNGIYWEHYTDDEALQTKVSYIDQFTGN